MKQTTIGLVLLATALLLTSCSENPTAAAEPAREGAIAVAAAPVTRQDLARDLELAAEFRPYQEIELHAKVPGYLKAIYVDVGDHVRKGQTIAELEAPEMAQELAQAVVAVKRAQTQVERARGELRRAEAAHTLQQVSYNRLASISKTRPELVAQQEIDDVKARYDGAEAQAMAAKAALAASEEEVKAALVSQERISTMMGYLRITAPFDGVVTHRFGDPGAMVQAGTASHIQAMPVVRLSQIDRLRLVLPVPESIASRVRVGAPVEIRVDSLNRVFQGRISRFSNKLDASTRTMETEVDLPNPNHSVLPGMYGYASLKVDRRNDALAVPVQAVAGHDSTPSVIVVNGQRRLEERKITLGIETPHLAEVLSGLKEGELVVIGGRSRLRPGALVEPRIKDGPELAGDSGRPGH